MAQDTVEERLDRLEKIVDDVVDRLGTQSGGKDWRRTIGAFDGDPLMKEMIDEAQRAREQERAQFYEEYDKQNGTS